jgi:methionyl-tRNA formyltransferase
MKVFFIGNVNFSRSMLETLLGIEEVQVVGIATKSKSNFNADHTDLSDLAIQNDIPFKFVKDINAPNIIEWISSVNPDVVYCMGWSSLIKTELLNLAPNGVIGYHPAKLPQNRGRHPLIWALVLGLRETASTFFKMNEGADTGDIVSQVDVKIEEDFIAADLYEALIQVSKEQIKDFTLGFVNGEVTFLKQDHSKSNYWRKRGMLDGQINFSSNSKTIFNLVRGLSKPYVGAHLFFENQEVKIWSCEIGPVVDLNLEPGKVLEVSENRILIKTGDASIWIDEHDFSILPQKNSYIL